MNFLYIDLMSKEPNNYLAPPVVEKMRTEIQGAKDNEVFFIGYTEEDLLVHDVEAAARGHKTAAPAVLEKAREADVVIHNHPSGDPTPSADDVAVTRELVKAGQILDIEVLDHLVIGDGRHVSLRRKGLGFS